MITINLFCLLWDINRGKDDLRVKINPLLLFYTNIRADVHTHQSLVSVNLLHKCSIFNASLAQVRCNLWLGGRKALRVAILHTLRPWGGEVKQPGSTPTFKDEDAKTKSCNYGLLSLSIHLPMSTERAGRRRVVLSEFACSVQSTVQNMKTFNYCKYQKSAQTRKETKLVCILFLRIKPPQ